MEGVGGRRGRGWKEWGGDEPKRDTGNSSGRSEQTNNRPSCP